MQTKVQVRRVSFYGFIYSINKSPWFYTFIYIFFFLIDLFP